MLPVSMIATERTNKAMRFIDFLHAKEQAGRSGMIPEEPIDG
jgi:hypothetical protein